MAQPKHDSSIIRDARSGATSSGRHQCAELPVRDGPTTAPSEDYHIGVRKTVYGASSVIRTFILPYTISRSGRREPVGDRMSP